MERTYITAGVPENHSYSPGALVVWKPVISFPWATGLQLLTGAGEERLGAIAGLDGEAARHLAMFPAAQKGEQVSLGAVDTKKVAGLEPASLHLTKTVSSRSAATGRGGD